MHLEKPDTEISTKIGFIHKTGGIKPLIEDIYLLTTYVAGLYYYVDIGEFKEEISVGNHLKLFRESNNSHDARAILIEHNGEKIGYIPRNNNEILANLMDAGKLLYGKVENIVEGDYNTLEISFKVFMKE